MNDTIHRGNGDQSDVDSGRCCPTCRHDLARHNVKVWNAGYATGVRHTIEDTPLPLAVAATRLHDAIYQMGEQVELLPEAVFVAWGDVQQILRREGVTV